MIDVTFDFRSDIPKDKDSGTSSPRETKGIHECCM